MDRQRDELGTDGDADECALRLSCLLDGELDARQCRDLVERLRNDEQARHQWALLNCVGDALRSAEVASWHSTDFVGRVAAALEREPTVLAPVAPARTAMRRWLVPAGVAAAAVAMLAVGVPLWQQAPTAVVAGTAEPSIAPVTAAAGTAGAVIDRSPQLERYLTAHRELAAPAVMPSSTPYVRTSSAAAMQEGR